MYGVQQFKFEFFEQQCMIETPANFFGPTLRVGNPAFSGALNGMAETCVAAQAFLADQQPSPQDMVAGRVARLEQRVARLRRWWAVIDGPGDTDGWYKAHEVIYADFAGTWFNKASRTWNGDSSSGATHLPDLLELNLQLGVPVGDIVSVRLMLDDAGNPVWWFEGNAVCAYDSSSESSASSSEPDSDCVEYYVIEGYDPDTFFDVCEECDSGNPLALRWLGRWKRDGPVSGIWHAVGATYIAGDRWLVFNYCYIQYVGGAHDYWGMQLACVRHGSGAWVLWRGTKPGGGCPNGVYTRVDDPIYSCSAIPETLTLIEE